MILRLEVVLLFVVTLGVGNIPMCASVMPKMSSGLETTAAESFFDLDAEMEQDGIPHVPGEVSWAERCLYRCHSACVRKLRHVPIDDPWLKLLKWDRDEDCTYRCCQACIGAELKRGGKHWKYKGHWTHRRALGLREPLSAVFSVANMAAHIGGLRLVLGGPLQGWHGKWRHATSACMWVVAWASSAVYHGMPTQLTERLDYYSGNAAMGLMLYVGVVRAGWHSLAMHVPAVRCGFLGVLSAGLGAHMLGGRHGINYALNMKIMISMVVMNSLAWLSVCLSNPQPHNIIFYVANGMLYLAGLLEVKDFPPLWGFLDAHAAWHAATPLLSYAFYYFWLADGRANLQVAAAKDK